MKVMQINSVCGIGSTGKIMVDIHKLLLKEGNESFVAYGRDSANNCTNSIKIGIKFDNYIHVFLTRFFDLHGHGSYFSTKKFIKKIEQINPDIIHLHNIHGYFINIRLLFNFLKKFNKPVVWTLHDCWSFTGHCSYFEYINCSKWQQTCFDCPQLSKYPKSIFFDNSRRNFLQKKELFNGLNNLHLVTPSIWLKKQLENSFLSKYSVNVINNGIDITIFKRNSSDLKYRLGIEDKHVILGVANVWDERKGFDRYIELSKHLNDNEIIILIGLDKKRIKDLPKNILGIEKTKNQLELVEYYSNSDVFLNLTLEDNYPTVNLEAISCETPVITFDSGGAKETLKSNYGEVISNDTHPTQIMEIVRKYYKMPLLTINYSEFDKESKFREYINLYTKIVGDSYATN